MATTMYFEEVVTDKINKNSSFEIEFGRSSYYDGENLIYLNVDGKGVILDEATGRRLCEAMEGLAGYLGYRQK